MMSRCLLCVTKGYRKRIPGRKGKKELIHQYKNNGFNIVLDVNSGAVHVVDCFYGGESYGAGYL